MGEPLAHRRNPARDFSLTAGILIYMSMMPFNFVFRELAEQETAIYTLAAPMVEKGRLILPADEYAFTESYCVEEGCDCRRVMINVLARYAGAHVATINYAFDPPTEDDIITDQTFLDPLNPQSDGSPALLDLFLNLLHSDENYRQRLERHYRIFKEAVADPAHPCQQYFAINPELDRGFVRRKPFNPIIPNKRKKRRR